MAFLNKSGVERLWAHIVSLVNANKTTIDNSLTQSGAAADAKVVGDLWNLVADDNDAEQLLQELNLTSSQRRNLTDEGGTILTD